MFCVFYLSFEVSENKLKYKRNRQQQQRRQSITKKKREAKQREIV